MAAGIAQKYQKYQDDLMLHQDNRLLPKSAISVARLHITSWKMDTLALLQLLPMHPCLTTFVLWNLDDVSQNVRESSSKIWDKKTITYAQL